MRKPIKLMIAIAAVASFAFITPSSNVKPTIVVIDAGHGGKDFGASHHDHLEKDITEKIAAKIKAMNSNSNVIIHFTRSGDEFMELKERTAFINKLQPDLVLSLHVNANANASASGIELYSAAESATAIRSAELALKLKNKFETKSKLKVNDLQTAPFSILKNANVPAIVVELGYISNTDDRTYLTDTSQQDRIAETILDFICEL